MLALPIRSSPTPCAVPSEPKAEVRLHWLSRSTSNTRCFFLARAAPRLRTVVVLPVPPLLLITLIMFDMKSCFFCEMVEYPNFPY